MVEERITDGYRIAELLASEVDGRRDGPLGPLAVANPDRSVEGTPAGERAYDVRRLAGERDPRREPTPEEVGELLARAYVHEEGATLAVGIGDATVGAARAEAASATDPEAGTTNAESASATSADEPGDAAVDAARDALGDSASAAVEAATEAAVEADLEIERNWCGRGLAVRIAYGAQVKRAADVLAAAGTAME